MPESNSRIWRLLPAAVTDAMELWGNPSASAMAAAVTAVHIVDSDHRIDRVAAGEFQRGSCGCLRMPEIERQDIAGQTGSASPARSVPMVTVDISAAGCLEECLCSIGSRRQEKQKSRHRSRHR